MMDNNPWADEWFPMVFDEGSCLSSIAEEVEAGYARPQAMARVERHCKSADLSSIRRALRRPKLRVKVVKLAKIGV